jgi:TPP-dependent pyruvate/acetoin dehydrogenase alpha subunit
MNIKFSKEDLISFENSIADAFNNKMIRAPIHLHEGNEEPLISLFTNYINAEDWLFTTWRSHYHCLLKGVSPEKLKQDILDSKSITLCYKEQKIVSSAIVTGNLSIAVGTALDIKNKKNKEKVWVFSGDMTSTTGAWYEAYNYSLCHDLPINFVIEDNGKSVCTITKDVWNNKKNIGGIKGIDDGSLHEIGEKLFYYSYKMLKYQHAGTGVRVQF